MRNIWLVAKREYLEQVRGRAFKMTTFGVPAIFAALLIGVGYLSILGLGSGRHLCSRFECIRSLQAKSSLN